MLNILLGVGFSGAFVTICESVSRDLVWFEEVECTAWGEEREKGGPPDAVSRPNPS